MHFELYAFLLDPEFLPTVLTGSPARSGGGGGKGSGRGATSSISIRGFLSLPVSSRSIWAKSPVTTTCWDDFSNPSRSRNRWGSLRNSSVLNGSSERFKSRSLMSVGIFFSFLDCRFVYGIEF